MGIVTNSELALIQPRKDQCNHSQGLPSLVWRDGDPLEQQDGGAKNCKLFVCWGSTIVATALLILKKSILEASPLHLAALPDSAEAEN